MPQSAPVNPRGPTPVAIIAAVSRNGVIGRGNALPWHLPGDLRHFKHLTLGKAVIMGRRTRDSIGRPLPGRDNIVVSRTPDLILPGYRVCASLDAALALAAELRPGIPAMVIGGGQLYRLALPLATWMYLTRVHADIEGDTCFPDFDVAGWRQLRREDHPASAADGWDYSFIDYRRVTPGRAREH